MKILYSFILAELLMNAYADYNATINGIQSPKWEEGNPIAAVILNNTTYDQQKLLGFIYIISLAYLYKMPEPFNFIIIRLADVLHFYCAYSWRNTGYLKYSIRLTLMRFEW